MQKSNSSFLKTQLSKFLSQNEVGNLIVKNTDQLKYIIEYDSEEKQESKTNSDDIMKYWCLPEKIGIRLELDDVCESLTTHANEIPLWIKVNKTKDVNVLKLLISKRFRKLKIIKERHQTNEYMPILK